MNYIFNFIMFSQKHTKKYTISPGPGKELSLLGVSRAAKATCFYCPELKIMLDAGYPMEYSPNVVVITHLHWDHVAEIIRVMLSAEKTKRFLLIICPYPSIGYLKNLIESSYRATKRIPLGTPVRYPPHAIIGCKLGETKEESSIILDITRKNMDIIGCADTTFQRGQCNMVQKEGHGVEELEPPNREERMIKMTKPLEILGIRCEHTQATTGYGFAEYRYMIKDEYMDANENGKRKCKLSREEMKELNSQGKMAEYKTHKRIPLFAFLCDTDHKVFKTEPPYNGEWIKEYPVLVIECTFFQDSEIKKAKKDKHMHWKNLEPYVKMYPQTQFKLMHLSERYTDHEITQFKSDISCYGNVEILIDLGSDVDEKPKSTPNTKPKKKQKPKQTPKQTPKPRKKKVLNEYLVMVKEKSGSIFSQHSRTVRATKHSGAIGPIINEIKQKHLGMEQSPLEFEIVFVVINKKCTTHKFLVSGKLGVNEKTNKCDYKIQVHII